MRAPIGSHDDCEAGHAFATNQAHLDAPLVIAVGNNGDDTAIRKVNVPDGPSAHFYLLP